MFENANGLVACDGREILKEFIKRNAGFEILQQSRYRNTRSGEDRSAAHDLAVDGDRNVLGDRHHDSHFNTQKAPANRGLFDIE